MAELVNPHKVVTYTWKEFDKDSKTLARRILEKGNRDKYSSIYGIPRGGLTLAVTLSHLLKIPLVTTFMNHLDDILVVDEIADAGTQLKPHVYMNRDTVVIHKNINCGVEPTFWLYESTHWIDYPWEMSLG